MPARKELKVLVGRRRRQRRMHFLLPSFLLIEQDCYLEGRLKGETETDRRGEKGEGGNVGREAFACQATFRPASA